MNTRIVLGIFALAALTACESASQMEQKPATWTAVYQANWQKMANCIIAGSQGPLTKVSPTFSAGRAEVVTTAPTGTVTGTFTIRAIGGGGTEVAYRSIYGGPTTDAGSGAKSIADRCARP